MSNPLPSFTATVHGEGYVDVSKPGAMSKKISLRDYVNTLTSLLGEEDQDIAGTTFRYPRSLHSMSRTGDGYILNLYYDEQEAELRHTSAGRHRVYMPNVMIRVVLKEVKGQDGSFSLGNIRWFCTDKPRISLPTEWPNSGSTQDHIWSLPFPNMYGDARMCTGQNRLPSVIYHDWSILDMLYDDVLTGSAFNNDLSVPSLATSSNPGDWIRTLGAHYLNEDSERFPYELLANY